MRHNDRKCGCGAIFTLPTLMSRETSCYACSRKKARSALCERGGETRPPVPLNKAICDQVALGVAKRPEPLRVTAKVTYSVPGFESSTIKADAEAKAKAIQTIQTFERSVFNAAVMGAYKQRIQELAKMPPRTVDGAIHVMESGWVLRHKNSLTQRRILAGVHQYRNNGKAWESCNHRADPRGGGGISPTSLAEGGYEILRPEE